jgi:hypothetical protein
MAKELKSICDIEVHWLCAHPTSAFLEAKGEKVLKTSGKKPE